MTETDIISIIQDGYRHAERYGRVGSYGVLEALKAAGLKVMGRPPTADGGSKTFQRIRDWDAAPWWPGEKP